MKLKGEWNDGTTYSVGDVVLHSDGFVYHLQNPCAAGIGPEDSLYWGKVNEALADAVRMALDAAEMAITQSTAVINSRISDDAISLKDESDNEYLITIDASGDTPDLAVTLVEEEEEASI